MSLLSCLRVSKALRTALLDNMMGHILHEMNSAARPNLSFIHIHRKMIEGGLNELDIESSALLYDELRNSLKREFGNDIDSSLTSSNTLDKIINGPIDKYIRENVGVTTHKDGSVSYNRQSIPKAIAFAVLKMLNGQEYGVVKNQTDALKIKNALLAYTKSLVKAKSTGGSVKDLLAQALEKDMLGSDWGSMELLFNQIKPLFDEMAAKIKDPAVRQKFLHDTEKLNHTMFNLGINESNRGKILQQELANSKYGKDVVSNGKQKRVPDWNKIAQAGNMKTVLREVLSDKLDKLGYSGSKDRVYNALIDNYQNIKSITNSYNKAYAAQQKKQAAATERKSGLTEQVAISKGFYKVNNGKKVVDYSASSGNTGWVANEMASGGHPDQGSVQKNIEFLVDKYIASKNYSQIGDAIRRLTNLNNRPYKRSLTKLEKLGRRLKNDIGLDSTTDAIASNIVGSRFSSNHIEKMRDVISRFNQLSDPAFNKNVAGGDPLLQKYTVNSDYDQATLMANVRSRLFDELSDIITDAVYEGKKGALPKSIIKASRTLDGIQKANLSAKLVNAWNLAQNVTTAINVLAGTDGAFSKFSGKNSTQDFFKVFGSVMSGDGLGLTTDAAENSDIKNFQDAKTFVGKFLGAMKIYDEGLLSAIDTGAQIVAVRNYFFDKVYEELKLRDPAHADKIMKDYFSNEMYTMANKMGERQAELMGLKRGTARFNRAVHLNAIQNQMTLFAQEGVIKPDRLTTYYKAGTDLVKIKLGKTPMEIASEQRHLGPLVTSLTHVPRWIVKRVDEFTTQKKNAFYQSESPSAAAEFMMAQLLHLSAHSLAPFTGGIANFADKAVYGTGWGFLHNKYTGRNQHLDDVISKSMGGTYSKGDKAVNESELRTALVERGIAKHKFLLARNGVAATALFLAAGVAAFGWGKNCKEDPTCWIREVDNGLYELGKVNPGLEKLIRTVLPPWIRVMYAYKNFEEKGSKGVLQVGQSIGEVLSFGSPITGTGFYDRYFKHHIAKPDEFRWAAAISTMSSGIIGIGDPIVAPILNFWNFGTDIARGRSNILDYNNNPIAESINNDMPVDNVVVNGVAYGFFGRAASMAWGNAAGKLHPVMGDLMLLNKDEKVRPFKEYQDDILDKTPDQIDWAKYGNYDMERNKKDVSKVLPHLDDIEDEVRNIGETLGFKDLSDKTILRHMFTYAKEEPFMIDISSESTINAVKSNYPHVALPKKGSTNLNVLNIVNNRLRLKFDITDIQNAIRFRTLQVQLAK